MIRRSKPRPIVHGLSARLRIDRRTKNLVGRLQPGEIAVIDHEDLDRIAVDGLLRAHVGAVINTKKCVSGRYPNVGPLLLAAANIPIIDNVGESIFNEVIDGDVISIDGNEVFIGGKSIAQGSRQNLETLEAEYESAKSNLDAELASFAINTLEYMQTERKLIIEPPQMPPLKTDMSGRQVLIVVRGRDYREDLSHLRAYIQEQRPIVIGVDGGGDAVKELGIKPDIVVGDFDSVSEATLRSGVECVVHAYPDGNAPGAQRLDRLGVPYVCYESTGTSEDIAMLIAHESGAELIVAVGTHASMVEFLEKGRAGMASTFLTRLKVGPILVDAKGVSRLYQSRVHKRDLVALVVAAVIAMIAITLVSYPLRSFFSGLWFLISQGWR
jgi:uncharacterized membrane-anchored protein